MKKTIFGICILVILLLGCREYIGRPVQNCNECYDNETCSEIDGIILQYECISFENYIQSNNSTLTDSILTELELIQFSKNNITNWNPVFTIDCRNISKYNILK